LYKILFAKNFVRNTYKFYNFVGNNYPQENYLLIKIFRKIGKKSFFVLANYFYKFTKKVLCNIKNYNNAWLED